MISRQVSHTAPHLYAAANLRSAGISTCFLLGVARLKEPLFVSENLVPTKLPSVTFSVYHREDLCPAYFAGPWVKSSLFHGG